MPIEVAMMIGVSGREAIATDVVVCFDSFNNVYGKWQACDPWLASVLVLQIKLGRWRVSQSCFCAEIVDRANQEMWLLGSHQIHIAHRSLGVTGQCRAPDQASRPVAEQIGSRNADPIIHTGKDVELLRFAPAVSRLVEIQTNAISVQVDDIDGT